MKLSCIHCDFAYTVTAAQLGMKGQCPKCGGTVRIPRGAEKNAEKKHEQKHAGAFRSSLSACVSMLIHLLLILLLMMITWHSSPPGVIGEEVGMGVMPTGNLSDSSGLTFGDTGAPNETQQLEVEAVRVEAPVVEFGEVASKSTVSKMAPSASTVGGGGNAEGLKSGGGSGGAGGGGGGASFMGVGASGQRFCLIADYSGSMDGPKLNYTKYEIEKMIRGLRRGSEFHVIVFSDDAKACPGDPWFPARATTKLAAIDWVKRVRLGEGTDPLPAFFKAFRLDPKPDVIWLMTDGIFDENAVNQIRRLNVGPKRSQIHTIALLNRNAEGLLRQIAADSGGTYTYVGRLQ